MIIKLKRQKERAGYTTLPAKLKLLGFVAPSVYIEQQFCQDMVELGRTPLLDICFLPGFVHMDIPEKSVQYKTIFTWYRETQNRQLHCSLLC